MTTLGIIGTAGRRDDKARMTKALWVNMLADAIYVIQEQKPTTLVSGGAAWADHLAVKLYTQGLVPNLELFLPAYFHDYAFVSSKFQDPASISNYYHKLMTQIIGTNSLFEIQKAINMGAQVHVIEGFKHRNLGIGAKADYLLAMTFGTHNGCYTQHEKGWNNAVLAGLKDGDTAHTWNHASSPFKEHRCLPI